MTFIQRFKLSVYLVVTLSFVGLTYSERKPYLLFIALSLLAVSWFLVESRSGPPVPRWCINLGVFISSTLLFSELVILRQDSLLLALGHFMIAIILCKSFESKSSRDYSQILVLSLLVLVIGSIFSSSLFFGAIFALYLGLDLYTILLFHLRNESLAAHVRGTPLPAPLTEPPLREDLRRIAVVAGAAMACFAAAVFLFFPRDRGRDMFGAWTIGTNTLITGFSDNVSLSPGSPILESDTVVMQVQMEQNGAPYGNAGIQPYFRGLTLDFYDVTAGQWLRVPPFFTRRRGEDDKGVIYVGSAGNPAQGLSLIKQKYTVFNSGEILFSLPEALTLRSNQIPRDRMFTGVQRNDRDNSLVLLGHPPSEFQYEIQSSPRYLQQRPPSSPRRAITGHLLVGTGRTDPVIQPAPIPQPIIDKAHEIADPVHPGDGSPRTPAQTREIAERMVQALLKYHYTIDNPDLIEKNLDPIADFVKNKQNIGGHCEYFASAMVLMCTALNPPIPARMATGYHGGTYNTVGDFYVVRQRNAHAWVEVYLDGDDEAGWTIFDPTPTSLDIDTDDRSIWVTWSEQLFQTLEHQWLSSIVGFDDSTRQYLFENTLLNLQALPQWTASTFSSIATGFADLVTARKISVTARVAYVCEIPALIACILWLTARLLRRRQSTVRKLLRQSDRPNRRQLAQELVFFDEFLRILRKTGVRQAAWQTPREYVNLACSGRNDAKAQADWVVNAFYEIWFGEGKITPQLRERINQSLSRLRQLLSK